MLQPLEYGMDAVPVTKSDTVDLIRPSQASLTANSPANAPGQRTGLNWACGFTVAVAGNLALIDALGNTQTFAVIAGFFYPIRASRVMSTNTTATGIIAFFPVAL